MKAEQMKSFYSKAAKLILINLLVFTILCCFIELGFRLSISYKMPSKQEDNPIDLKFLPYVMFGGPPNHIFSVWVNKYTKETIKSVIKTNSLGIPNDMDFGFNTSYHKQENEKTVLFTGGSAAWGVGASSNSTTITGRLASLLNRAQSKNKYTVINLAMGGWIARQQAIALDLWGRQFEPDWIVVMDGTNDAAVGCGFSAGTANPLYFPLMESFFQGYMVNQKKIPFYRGVFENLLIKYSLAYRTLTKKKYVPRNQKYDPESDVDTKFVIQVTPFSEVDKQLDFYINSQRSILEMFQSSKVILSTQPSATIVTEDSGVVHCFDHENNKMVLLGDQAITKSIKNHYKDRMCGGALAGAASNFIFGQIPVKIDQLVISYRKSNRRDVEYYNLGILFPKNASDRRSFFIDQCHLTDTGQDLVARFYAKQILRRDMPGTNWDRVLNDI